MRAALIDSLKKLDPRTLWRNPVMFAVEIASIITLVTFIMSLTGDTTGNRSGSPARSRSGSG